MVKNGIGNLGTLLLLPWLMLLAAAPLQAAEWNQERVTALAGELNAKLKLLLQDETDSQEQPDIIGDRNLSAGLVDVRQLQKEVARLEEMLAKGRSRDQTQAFMQKINSLRGSIRDYTRNSVISPEAERIAGDAAALLDDLQRYYE